VNVLLTLKNEGKTSISPIDFTHFLLKLELDVYSTLALDQTSDIMVRGRGRGRVTHIPAKAKFCIHV